MSSREGVGLQPPSPAGGEDVLLRRATAQSCASVVAGSGSSRDGKGRIPEEGLAKLKKHANDCVIIDPDVLERCRGKWRRTLFGRFLGRGITLERLKGTLATLWRGIDGFSVSDMEEGYYVFRFDNEEDMMYAVSNGPWMIMGRVLNLISWRNNFRPTAEAFTTTPIWIQLPNLPKEYWELEALIPVAAYFGKPLRVDETTLDHTRSRFARVCVEIDLAKPLKTVVWLGPKEDELEQVAIYEGILALCYRCGRIGHMEEACPNPRQEGSRSSKSPEEVDKHGKAANEARSAEEDSDEAPIYGPWVKV
ncbi:uncharacterized protein [Typha latifolia]|uniref:uncharacterized protein n=1 Tax=Typha latifolia TaxID=4733 RepID=UPI003C2DDA78